MNLLKGKPKNSDGVVPDKVVPDPPISGDPPKDTPPPTKISVGGKDMGVKDIEKLISTAENNPQLQQQLVTMKAQLQQLEGLARLGRAASESGLDLGSFKGVKKDAKDDETIPDFLLEITGEGGEQAFDFNPNFTPALRQQFTAINEKLNQVTSTQNAVALGTLKNQNMTNRMKFQMDNKFTDEQMAEHEQWAVENKKLTTLGSGSDAITVIDYSALEEVRDLKSARGLTDAITSGDANAMVDAMNKLPGAEKYEFGARERPAVAPRLSGAGGGPTDSAVVKHNAYAENKVKIHQFTQEEVEHLENIGRTTPGFRKLWENEMAKKKK